MLIRRVFRDLGGLASLAHDQKSVTGADDLFDALVYVAVYDEEQQRVGANVLVLRDRDDEPRGAGVVVALADDPELWIAPEQMDALLNLFVLVSVRRLVQRQGSLASADAPSLAFGASNAA